MGFFITFFGLIFAFILFVVYKNNKESAVHIALGKQFLDENKNGDGVNITSSGLQYKILESGEGGVTPIANQTVKVHYQGKLISGEVFDSSIARGEPIEFPLNRVIPGWTEGLQLMSKGDKYEFFIPHYLAYGKRGAGTIPPGATLIFEVTLLDFT